MNKLIQDLQSEVKDKDEQLEEYKATKREMKS